MSAKVKHFRTALCLGALLSLASNLPAQAPYQPTLASLDTHPLPQWFSDAKVGVMVVWGLYSVPGWAPLSHKTHDFGSTDYIRQNPYAEWYYNVMRIQGTPTWQYHRDHYGPNFNYYDFAADFEKQSRNWNPDTMAATLKDAGIQYIVFTAKFHDGFNLWPTAVPNPNQQNLQLPRDYVGEFSTAVRKAGMHMGLYYSGGYDWTFDRGPIEADPDYQAVKPQSTAYGVYADAQIKELIARYHPEILWNDIDWPKSGNALQVMSDYYNAIPNGVVDDRFGVPHSDFNSPEYSHFDEIKAKKWEEVRGLGQSFGYNRAEGEADTIAPDELIYLLADVVSKNGNLLLGVGPEADGSISPVQTERLQALGAWLKQNGEAIYATTPWLQPKPRAAAQATDGTNIRFTTKGKTLYAILLGKPKSQTLTIPNLTPAPHSAITLQGAPQPLTWTQSGPDLKVNLPATLPGNYAYVLRLQPSE